MGRCFITSTSLAPHLFLLHLVKTKSDFIVRSVETALGKWMLVIAAISVDAYLLLAFSNLTCHLEEQKYVFYGCPVLPDIKETWIRSSNQEASLWAGKNARIVLVLCCRWKCVSTAISGGVDIPEVCGCHFLQQMSSQWGSQKLLQGLVSPELTA